MENLVIFAPFLMVVGIVWIIARTTLEEKRIKLAASESVEKATQYATRMAEMDERLRVLERIVTDKGYDVATQIEALRDQRRVQEQIEDHAGLQ
jgi:anti-sigma regulatory factor (Ser/Thr protein kinase)